MSKHVAAVLADLRERQIQLAAEQADIGEAIAVLEKMNGGAPATPPRVKPHERARPQVAGARKPQRVGRRRQRPSGTGERRIRRSSPRPGQRGSGATT